MNFSGRNRPQKGTHPAVSGTPPDVNGTSADGTRRAEAKGTCFVSETIFLILDFHRYSFFLGFDFLLLFLFLMENLFIYFYKISIL
jgi:hypothetical protein